MYKKKRFRPAVRLLAERGTQWLRMTMGARFERQRGMTGSSNRTLSRNRGLSGFLQANYC